MNVNATLSAQQVAVAVGVQGVGATLSGTRPDIAFSSSSSAAFTGPNDLSPTTVAGHKSIPFDSTPFPDAAYDTIEYSNFKVVTRHSWFGRFAFPIPAGSTITNAFLRLVTTTGGDANVITARFWLPSKDGIWDNVGPNSSWVVMNDTTGATTEAWGFQSLMQTAGGGANLSSGPGLGSIDVNVKYNWGVGVITDSSGVDAIAQTLVCTTSGNFRRLQFRLGRSGSPTGSIRFKMYPAMANDGSDDRPNTSTLLATSNDIVATAVPVNGLVNIDFPADVAVTSGQRYTFALEVDYAYGTAYIRSTALVVDSYAGSACVFGQRFGAASCAYGVGPMWPHLYREDAITIHEPAFGSVLEYVLNTTWTGNQDFDLTTLVQEWVASPSYAPGFVMVGAQAKDTGFLASRRFTSAQLFVTGFTNVPSVIGGVTAQRFSVALDLG